MLELPGVERQVPPPDAFLLDMLEAGGLIALARSRPELFEDRGAQR